jgi:hypothetical protein
MDDAWELVPSERLEQLCPPVGFERSSRVVGKTSGVAQPSCAADLNHHLGARAPSVIPQSQPRASTPVRVPAKLALISQPTTRHYETPRTCSFRATRCKELLVTISVWSADRSGYLAFTVEQSSSPKVPWSVLAWLGGGEKVGEQLGDALSLVVMDPVRGVGQALDAVEVGHVVVLGLG